MKLTCAVIIPTYNRPSDLIRAIDSVYSQSRVADEVWVVNDGEKHNGFDHLIKKYPTIKIIHNPFSRGANFSRNLGAKLAATDVLMFLDDDDWWASSKIDAQMSLFEKDPFLGLIYSGKNVVYDSIPKKVQYKIHCQDYFNPYKEILMENFIGTTSSVAIKKEVFEQAGCFDESLPAMQDYDLWIRICKISKVRYDQGFHVFYTVNKGTSKGQISKSGVNQIKASDIIFDKYLEDFKRFEINLSKRKGKFYFKIAKAIRNTSFRKALPWILKSFFLAPSLKTLYLMISTEKPF
ncbi:glycosyltransferase family 2 protein [Mongoliitalea lutea]|uniref:Glycosyltransferase 2-like domain-containing protein n=1 Tax=Mongoliitalea lutea TaxID=849756 RepID=A0A8J3G4W9_9BACT|nr:glycosyltransferase family 2 protein [Mongoliitalea lutea]GHB31495.1 hypothetical protein GCM10008106_10370 [Mongoliitalea lutea]